MFPVPIMPTRSFLFSIAVFFPVSVFFNDVSQEIGCHADVLCGIVSGFALDGEESAVADLLKSGKVCGRIDAALSEGDLAEDLDALLLRRGGM